MCHVLHYNCNVNAAVADSLRCRMICGTVPSSVHSISRESRQVSNKRWLIGRKIASYTYKYEPLFM